MMVYIAKYDDSMYPEDNRIIGLYRNKESAQRAIDSELMYYFDPKNPTKHLSNRFYYTIEEHEVYD